MASYYWFKNERYVYLRPIVCCFDPTNHGVFVEIFSLYRLDLTTGEFLVILSGKDKNLSPFVARVSPDEKYLAYVDLADEPYIVYIDDLQSRERKSIKLDESYIDIGSFTWSIDSKELVFVAGFDGWTDLKAGFSLYKFDLDKSSLETIIYDDQRLLMPCNYPDSWVNDETLLLCEFLSGAEWAVNTQSKLLEAKSTSTP